MKMKVNDFDFSLCTFTSIGGYILLYKEGNVLHHNSISAENARDSALGFASSKDWDHQNCHKVKTWDTEVAEIITPTSNTFNTWNPKEGKGGCSW